MAISCPESQSAAKKVNASPTEVEFAKCACCGLTEECTPAYIAKVRERYQGRWICGLCSEAVKDEIFRSDRRIGTEEALNRHTNFFKKFRSSSPPANPTKHLVSAMRQILRKSSDSPRTTLRSNSAGSRSLRNENEVRGSSLVRSEGCFSALAG